MAEKPANQDLSQAISQPFLGSEFETMYEQYMDMMLIQVGRDVKLWMAPAFTESTSNPEQYNPWLRSKDPRLGGSGEGNNGSIVEPIYVTYRAHVMHGPKKNTPDVPWDLNAEDVMLSMVIGALDDIKKAVEVEIDGIKYARKSVDIKQIGLTVPKYLITFWSRKVAD